MFKQIGLPLRLRRLGLFNHLHRRLDGNDPECGMLSTKN